MIEDDFDIDDTENTMRDVSLASTKMVVGQHIQLLAERFALNQRVGRQVDELVCAKNLIETLQRYVTVLSAPEGVTEELI